MKNINKLIKISLFSMLFLTKAPITPHIHTIFNGLIEQADRDVVVAALEASVGGDNRKELESIAILGLIRNSVNDAPSDLKTIRFTSLVGLLTVGNNIEDDYNRSKYMHHLSKYIESRDEADIGFMRILASSAPSTF